MTSGLRKFLLLAAALAAVAGTPACGKRIVEPERLGYRVIAEKPHDPYAYTQGLQWVDGRLFESTGQYGQSTLREVDPADGVVKRKRPLAATVFGEGMTLLGGEIWMISWKEKTAFVFDPESFKLLRQYTYEGEGWGLTTDGKRLIMSDGSNTLKFINPQGFTVEKTVEVTSKGAPQKLLNELEYIDGQVFANIYTTDRIVRIDPDDGQVTGILDLPALRGMLPAPNRAEVLNGIAYDSKAKRLIVTGKYWPRMFELELK